MKEVIFDDTIKEEVALDVRITPALKEEGMLRDIVREVQAQRKEAQLKPEDSILVDIFAEETLAVLLEKSKKVLLKEMRATNISVTKAEGQPYKITIKKVHPVK